MTPEALSANELKVLVSFVGKTSWIKNDLMVKTGFKKTMLTSLLERLMLLGLVDLSLIKRKDGHGYQNLYRVSSAGQRVIHLYEQRLFTRKADRAPTENTEIKDTALAKKPPVPAHETPSKAVETRSTLTDDLQHAMEKKPNLSVWLRGMAQSFLDMAKRVEEKV